MSTIHEKLLAVQSELKAPKSQTNTFGKYKYRSCEDILEAVKPLLKDNGLVLTISDDVVEIGGRVYVKACAMVGNGDGFISAFGFARETSEKKGMDEAQITGSASSYARKYALNGLFCIDDTKDADATNTHGKSIEGSQFNISSIKIECRATPNQLKKIDELIDLLDLDEAKQTAMWTKFGPRDQLTESSAASLVKSLTKKLEANSPAQS